MSSEHSPKHYWISSKKIVLFILSIWFVVSFGFGVLLVEQLNTIRIGGFQLGFWFAQQGSIYVFVGLIFFYTARMRKIDKKYGVSDEDDE